MLPFPLQPVLIAVLAAAGSGYAVARWLGPRGFMDVPEGRRAHGNPIPRTGGLAFWLLLLLGHLSGWMALPFHPSEWAGLGILILVGGLDDRFGLRARWKAFIGLAVAAMIAVPGALRIVALQPHVQLLGFHLVPNLFLVMVLLVLLYWALPQSFNLIDGANGLAIGYALIVLAALAFVGAPRPLTMGLLFGLLVTNWPRAHHFLGDCGSLSLGLMLALLTKKAVGTTDPNLILWIFAYPIVDTSLVVAIRLAKGRGLGEGDRNHLHHQWGDRLPWIRRWVVPLLWFQAALCVSAVGVKGPFWVIPWAGLAALALQAGVFFVKSVRESSSAEPPPVRVLGPRRPSAPEFPSGSHRPVG